MLKTNHITFEFNGETILQDVNIRAEFGNITAISGISGSGKSLLFSILSDVLEPTSGDLEYPFNEEVRIGAVFQVPALISNLSVGHNLKLALQSHYKNMSDKMIDEKIKKTISSYDLYKYINDRPDSLSKGQRAIIAFCRATIVEPDFFFWDDPFMDIDENFYGYIENKIFEMKEQDKVIMFFTNHQHIISKYADSHYKIENGRVAYI